MPLNKLKDEADREETSDLLRAEYHTVLNERRAKLVQDCKDDFAEVFSNAQFALSSLGERSLVATYKELTIALEWTSLDECPRDVFFRFSFVKNSAETSDLIIVDLVLGGTAQAIPRDIESQSGESTAPQLRAAISTVRDSLFSFRIIRNFHPKTAIGDQPGEKSYDNFKDALAALAAVL